QTKPAPFHVNGGPPVDLPTMTQRHEWPYAEGNGFVALELPYSGYALRFLILLPNKVDGLTALEAKLSSDIVGGRLNWEECEVTLHLPKFKIEPPLLPLGKMLEGLGMKSAFNIPVGSANFDKIAPRRPDDYLYISE